MIRNLFGRSRGREPRQRGYARADLGAFVAREASADPREITLVLDLYDEYFMLANIMSREGHTWRYAWPEPCSRAALADPVDAARRARPVSRSG